MKLVRVDFNDEEPYGAYEGHCGKLELGESVTAFDDGDSTPFGRQGTVVRVRPVEGEHLEFYWIKLDEDTPWLEGDELGLEH